MLSIRAFLATIIGWLCLANISNPAMAAELLTQYQYGAVTYPSLPAAEQALWDYPFFGYI